MQILSLLISHECAIGKRNETTATANRTMAQSNNDNARAQTANINCITEKAYVCNWRKYAPLFWWTGAARLLLAEINPCSIG